jgi:hypothetical protein
VPTIVESERGKIEHFEWFTYEELQALAARNDGAAGLLVPNLQAALADLEPHMRIQA